MIRIGSLCHINDIFNHVGRAEEIPGTNLTFKIEAVFAFESFGRQT